MLLNFFVHGFLFFEEESEVIVVVVVVVVEVEVDTGGALFSFHVEAIDLVSLFPESRN